METSSIDRDQLKNILKEILEEKKSQSEDRKAKIKGLIEEDFDKYDDVFKALA